MMHIRRSGPFLAALVVMACGAEPGSDAGVAFDGATAIDGGAMDADRPDSIDAGDASAILDAAPGDVDASPSDDGGAIDAAFDAGLDAAPDAGTRIDAGPIPDGGSFSFDSIECYGPLREELQGLFVAAGGVTTAVGHSGHTVSPVADAIALRLSTDGAIVWQTRIGGSGFDELIDVHPRAAGGAIAFGTTASHADGQRIWRVELDADGHVVRELLYQTGSYGELSEAVATSDGGYLLVGQNGAADPNYGWVAKTDAAGAIEWQHGLAGDFGRLFAGAEIPGGYVVTGFTDEGATYNHLYAARLDASGAIVWQNRYGPGTLWSAGWSATATTAGIVIAGRYYDDAYALGLDLDGGVRFSRILDNTIADEDFFIEAVPTASGGAVLLGSTFYTSESPITHGYDLLLVEVDAAGALGWDLALGGDELDRSSAMVTTPGGRLAIAGRTESFAGYSLNPTGWLVGLGADGALDPGCAAGLSHTTAITWTDAGAAATAVLAAPSTPTVTVETVTSPVASITLACSPVGCAP